MSSSPSTNYVLVVITANGCSACTAFKQNWSDMKSKLSPLITIVEINQPQVSNEFDARYPRGLKNFVQFFPTLIVFEKKEWDAKYVTKGDVFNADIVNNKVQMKSGSALPLNATNVTNWLETKMVLPKNISSKKN